MVPTRFISSCPGISYCMIPRRELPVDEEGHWSWISHALEASEALCWVILACECCDYGERTALERAS